MGDIPESDKSKDFGKREVGNLYRDATNLFSSIFFGWNIDDGNKPIDAIVSSFDGKIKTKTQTPKNPTDRSSDESDVELSKKTSDAKAKLHSAIADQIEKLIPTDREELKTTTLYKSTYNAVQWQRDNYLVGTEYANWRKKERTRLGIDPTARSSTTQSQQMMLMRDVATYQDEIVYERTALGHQQIAKLGSWFIPSKTVHDALVPIVVGLPMGSLYEPSQQALVRMILGQQDVLDRVLKQQLLRFLQNPNNRAAIKNSTKGYISTTIYRDKTNAE